MKNIIDIQNLNFGFSKHKPILKDLTFSVPKGSIFGFLGANGAGKSTMMKLLLGNIPDGSNSFTIFNQNSSEFYPDGFNKIGSLIDSPALYDHLSGWDNLLIVSRLRDLPGAECERVLTLVGLWESRNMKVKKYSLGMKQRLGIAITLLGESELLVLDEPVNGLDPGGMVEIRKLLMELNKKHGITIFISSHLLQEIEKMITHLAIISHGEIKFTGSMEDLEKQYMHQYITVGLFNASKFVNEVPERYSPRIVDTNTIELKVASKKEVANIVSGLVGKGAEVFGIINGGGLEDWFMEITKY
ncbi:MULTISPECIES: ABC transporter ATP-binding protein [Chryseobacterium]|jgi:ABC-2 type transport system ATP-binding protein|uniref:ABC-2 type transport system ATP-binding protein n=1 Tax=Chryseobacterium geocarposphaerae TaxID=1416776 RepID=A0ABU1LBZ2_9FLAO|nr:MULTISPECIES: ABC transporter ATP-binding protein [Chryseobacterium]MDR6404055.1 ABC-2 type transport system ATP-binding protein [Chryseobacterium geocarposphaerae]MDR6698426.1 ABC-2 type transport system ATP-binding protein [Chryseobacterium ginsenosidimutans]